MPCYNNWYFDSTPSILWQRKVQRKCSGSPSPFVRDKIKTTHSAWIWKPVQHSTESMRRESIHSQSGSRHVCQVGRNSPKGTWNGTAEIHFCGRVAVSCRLAVHLNATKTRIAGVTAFCVLPCYLFPRHWTLVVCVPQSPPRRTIQCYVFPIYRAGFMYELLLVWFLCFNDSTNEWIS